MLTSKVAVDSQSGRIKNGLSSGRGVTAPLPEGNIYRPSQNLDYFLLRGNKMSIAVMNRVWDHSEAKGSELLLLITLADIARDNGIAWPSHSWLAQRTRLSERQVIRLLKQSNERGEIETQTKRGYGNTYWIKIEGPNGIGCPYCSNCGAIEDPRGGLFLHQHHYDPKNSDDTIALCEPCHNEEHGKTVSDKMSRKRKEAFKVTSGGTQLTFPTSQVTPMSPNTLSTPKEPLKDSRSNDKPRQISTKDKMRKEAAEHFSSRTNLPIPNPTTESQRRKAGSLWWSPIREICELAEWSLFRIKALIDTATLRLDGMTVSDPNSIVKTARAIIAESNLGKGELRPKEAHEMTDAEFTAYLGR